MKNSKSADYLDKVNENDRKLVKELEIQGRVWANSKCDVIMNNSKCRLVNPAKLVESALRSTKK